MGSWLRRRLGHERGGASIELALLLPLLLLVLMVAVPLVIEGWDYLVVTGATSSGIRYASRVDENARTTSTFAPACTVSSPTRRPSACEVQQFIQQAAAPLGVQVSVTPDPSQTLPGEPITVTATYTVNFPLAGAVNNFTRAFFGGGFSIPTSTVVNITQQGREE